MNDHLIISDGQVKPGVVLDHWYCLGKMIAELRPKVVVNIGDFWDMESLSSYDKGKRSAENKRYDKDISIGNEAMEALLWASRKQRNKPRMVFTLGNHEHRIDRFCELNPELSGKLSMNDLFLDDWEVYPFTEIANIDGVSYSHYFYNPNTGKPYGGTIHSMLKNVGYSFTMGHRQCLDFARRDLTNGRSIFGLVTGAFYQHDESYKGPQGNNHWRGVIHKKNVANGIYDLETWEINRVMQEFK